MKQIHTQGFGALGALMGIVALLLIGGGAYVYTTNDDSQEDIQKPIACTLEAKICPDGSTVGRTGPDCSFAPCPGGEENDTQQPEDNKNNESNQGNEPRESNQGESNEDGENGVDGGSNEGNNGDDEGVVVSEPESTCVTAGCSGTLCVDAGMAGEIVTTCEYKEVYACYQEAVCEQDERGMCGWRETEELNQCLGLHEQPVHPDTEELCVHAGGNWSPVPGAVLDAYTCYLPTADAGVACSDSNECEGRCLAGEMTEVGVTATGVCAEYRDENGHSGDACWQQVSHGVVEPMICF